MTRLLRGGGGRCSRLFLGVSHGPWKGVRGGKAVPLDFFLPRFSLLITSDRHCTDLPVGAWAPRRRRVAGAWVWVVVDGVLVWVWVGEGREACCCRDSGAADAMVLWTLCSALLGAASVWEGSGVVGFAWRVDVGAVREVDCWMLAPPGVRSGGVAVWKNVVLGEALFGIGKSCLVLESFKMAEPDKRRRRSGAPRLVIQKLRWNVSARIGGNNRPTAPTLLWRVSKQSMVG